MVVVMVMIPVMAKTLLIVRMMIMMVMMVKIIDVRLFSWLLNVSN
jgi:hypothetical protein